MKLIIPMAGKGTRLRPHTHVTPKPLLPVAGASMIERIVRTFQEVLPRKIDEAVFILGDFPPETKTQLREICSRYDIVAHFAYQEEALGTAHAVFCAEQHLDGEGIIVFADTLFYMQPLEDFGEADGVVWVKDVEDPSRFGVVVKKEGRITDFVEKPSEPISREAIIGIYYVREMTLVRNEIKYLLENELAGHGDEYQITDAFDRMLKQGRIFKTASVTDWLDCGTIDALMATTRVILDRESERPKQGSVEDSVLIEPVYVGPGAKVVQSIIGPHVAIEAGAEIHRSLISHSIVFADAKVDQAILADSLIGHHASVEGRAERLNVGDDSSCRRSPA
jgi:glucose-1-phosphate thymidylyltransferase